jgi:hypothetical protein
LNNSYIFLFKKKLNNTLFEYTNKQVKSNLILANNILNKNLKLKKLNFYEKNFKILLESNITNRGVEPWDIILPLTIVTENFLLMKNYFNIADKSLFLKFGPWLARNFFNFFQFFFKISIFPFFFFKNFFFFTNLNFFFLSFWLEGVCFSKKIKINERLFPLLINKKYYIFGFIRVCPIFFKNFWYRLDLYNNTKNFWYTEISFIKASKYGNLGFNLLKKESITFK